MMFRRITIHILCFFIIFSVCLLPSAATEDTAAQNLAVTSGCHSIDAAVPYLGREQLVENVQAAFMYETNSQTLLYEWNPDVQQYPASLVKIMTALLVLEQCDLTATVTVSQSALDTVSSDAISIDLAAGEQLTVEALLYAMLVQSANDAAAVLAEYTAGSEEAFVALMNSRAVELGCTGTNYVNPHGLHDDLQVTTARDICRVLLAALEHDIFRTMFGTVSYTVPATNVSEERILVTNNYLMNNTDNVGIYLDDRVTGGRTGVTTEGYRGIASLSESSNMEVICIVLGSASTFLEDGYKVDVFGGFPETIELLNKAYENNSMQQIIYENQILRHQSVINGDSDVFVQTREACSTVLPANYSRDDLVFRYSEVPGSSEAPIEKGQNLASLQVWYGSMCIAQTEVYAANAVPVAYAKSGSYIEPEKSGSVWTIVLVVLLILAAVIVTIIVLLRLHSKRSRTQSTRKHHRRRN